MAKYFGFNKPFFNFNVPNIKVDVSIVPEKYRYTSNPMYNNKSYYRRYDDVMLDVLSKPTCKIVFLIRHAARDSDATGPTSEINARGKEKAQELGPELKMADPSILNIMYLTGYGTEYYRTKQTLAYILKGIDSTTYADADTYANNIEDFTDIHGGLYTGDITDWQYISDYCSPTNWSEISIKSKRLITNVFDKIENLDKRYHIMVSHDQLLAPFIYYASDQTIHFATDNWVKFLSGVALILYDDYTYEIAPIIGTDNTFQ